MANKLLIFILTILSITDVQGQSTEMLRYTDSIKKYPNNPLFYYQRGFYYNNSPMNSELAIADFTKAIQLKPDYAEAYKWRGSCYSDIREYELAIKDYTKAISLIPMDFSLYIFRANGYEGLNMPEKAIESFNFIIKNANKDNDPFLYRSQAYFGLGAIQQKLKKYNQAITDLSKAIAINPLLYQVYWQRGNCYAFLGNYDLAIQDYESFLEQEPENKSVQENLELTLTQKRNLEKKKLGIQSFKVGSGAIYNTISVPKGAVITITASGSILLGLWAGSGGPEGISGYSGYNLVEGFSHGALLVRIGDNGEWKSVGNSKAIVAGMSGNLQFIVNDSDASNNSGFFTVDIRVNK